MPQTRLSISTRGQGLYEFTHAIEEFVADHGSDEGLLTVFVRHTSCSLLIQENADPDVQRDLQSFFSRLVPPSDDPSMSWVVHTMEGPDDMPAHIKAAQRRNRPEKILPAGHKGQRGTGNQHDSAPDQPDRSIH